MDGVDDLGVVDPLEVDAGDPEVRMPELALDHDERDPFMGHLDRVRMPELMRGEPASHASGGSSMRELLAGRRCLPVAPCGRPVDHA